MVMIEYPDAWTAYSIVLSIKENINFLFWHIEI